jgi:hypothetical protein
MAVFSWGMYTRRRDTHCRAASTICALRSRRLASRFAAESSHAEPCPVGLGAAGAAAGSASAPASRSSSRKRLISDGAFLAAGAALALAPDAPGAGAPSRG